MRLLSNLLQILNKLLTWLKYQIRLVKVGAKRGNPMFVGIGSTKLFLTFVGIMALLFQKEDGEWSWRIWSFLTSPPNEIGDTLAGIAGALAFLWIIVTVMLQSKELAAQRDELRLARKEFSRMADAQQQQVDLLVQQGSIFAEEQKQRAESRAEKVFEAKLKSIQVKITEAPKDSLIRWMFMVDDTIREKISDSSHKHLPRYTINESIDVFFANLRDSLIQVRKPKMYSKTPNLFNKKWSENDVSDLLKNFVQLEDLRAKLAEDQSIRLDALGLSAIALELEHILSNGEYPKLCV